MSSHEPESILRQVAARQRETHAPAAGPSSTALDESLAAYREGRLDPGDRERVEELLRRDAAARRRLVELAGVPPEPAASRGRVLRTVASRRRRAAWFRGAAVAAVLVTGVGFAILTRPSRLPADPGYEVLAQGRAAERSPGLVAGPVEAYPETRLRIVLRPARATGADVRFGLYRESAGALRRTTEVSLETRRGTAVFSGPAATLVGGSSPGTYVVYAVVALAGELPAEISLDPGQDPRAALGADPARRVYPQAVVLLPP